MHATAPLLKVSVPGLATIPDVAPPYDCAVHGTTCQVPAGPIAGVPAAASVGPVPVGQLRGEPSPGGPAGRSASCAVAIWPRQFAQAITETLAGTRPLRQILPWTTERAQSQIRVLGPLLRTTDGGSRIQRVLTSCPAAGVVEVTVIAGFGPRTRALAIRFEHVAAGKSGAGHPGRSARWLCTAIETG